MTVSNAFPRGDPAGLSKLQIEPERLVRSPSKTTRDRFLLQKSARFCCPETLNQLCEIQNETCSPHGLRICVYPWAKKRACAAASKTIERLLFERKSGTTCRAPIADCPMWSSGVALSRCRAVNWERVTPGSDTDTDPADGRWCFTPLAEAGGAPSERS